MDEIYYITAKKICKNFEKRINVRLLRGDLKKPPSMKLKLQMFRERFQEYRIQAERNIENDYIEGKIKKFKSYYCSDPWVKTELRILDKLNNADFYIDPKRINPEIPYSRFKQIQERIQNYKIPDKSGRTWEKAFRNFRNKMNNYKVEERRSLLDYRLADLVTDMNLKWRNHNDIPYILSKKYANRKNSLPCHGSI